ncbi:MAG: hypothetical protein LUQ25_06025 [Methanoregulaceae archaeon]|nr:hypothetical protein [Methanoregulaceae archaeon]
MKVFLMPDGMHETIVFFYPVEKRRSRVPGMDAIRTVLPGCRTASRIMVKED